MTRNPFGWDYPPGAEHDPNAPWNQPDPVECPWCSGTGVPGDDPLGKCFHCSGGGLVDPRDIEQDDYYPGDEE